jgi:hypothetical protein
MKRAPIISIFFLCVSLLWAALPAADGFNNGGANVLLTSYSGNWTHSIGTFQLVGNALATYSVAPAMAWWNFDTFGADQYAKAVLTGGIYGGNGVAARVTSSGNGYYGYIRHTNYNCCFVHTGRLDGGIETDLQLSTQLTPAAGDVLQIEVSGSNPTTLRVTLSRVTKGDLYDNTTTDSSGSQKTSGSAGVYGHDGGATTIALDSWEGGNLTSPSSAAKRRILR